jgi:gag-polypeptide of LTR copia-type
LSSTMSDEATIRVISFDGSKTGWYVYKNRMLAKAKVNKYRNVLEGKAPVPKEADDIDTSTEEGLVLERNRDANDLAYAALCLSCNGQAVRCVDLARTQDLPSGDAALAWKNLLRQYEPGGQMELVSLKKEFGSCSLESKKTDPDEWFTKLEHIRWRILDVDKTQAIDDSGMIAHVMGNLPNAYSELVTVIETEMDSDRPITIEQLYSRIRNFYRRQFASDNNGGIDGDNIALVAFKGTCRNCGGQGHKSFECKKPSTSTGTATTSTTSNSGGQPKNKQDLECTYCKKKGHAESYCFKKKKDDKAKKKEESADIALTTLCLEDMALSAILKEKDFFLCDSGASSHMTNSDEGLVDVTSINREVTLRNGSVVKATKMGSIQTVLNNSAGKNVKVTLKDVVYVPDLRFNLLSVGQIAKSGVTFVYNKEGAHLDMQSSDLSKVVLKSVGNGNVYGMNVNRVLQATPALEEGKAIDVKVIHSLLGHVGEDRRFDGLV